MPEESNIHPVEKLSELTETVLPRAVEEADRASVISSLTQIRHGVESSGFNEVVLVPAESADMVTKGSTNEPRRRRVQGEYLTDPVAARDRVPMPALIPVRMKNIQSGGISLGDLFGTELDPEQVCSFVEGFSTFSLTQKQAISMSDLVRERTQRLLFYDYSSIEPPLSECEGIGVFCRNIERFQTYLCDAVLAGDMKKVVSLVPHLSAPAVNGLAILLGRRFCTNHATVLNQMRDIERRGPKDAYTKSRMQWLRMTTQSEILKKNTELVPCSESVKMRSTEENQRGIEMAGFCCREVVAAFSRRFPRIHDTVREIKREGFPIRLQAGESLFLKRLGVDYLDIGFHPDDPKLLAAYVQLGDGINLGFAIPRNDEEIVEVVTALEEEYRIPEHRSFELISYTAGAAIDFETAESQRMSIGSSRDRPKRTSDCFSLARQLLQNSGFEHPLPISWVNLDSPRTFLQTVWKENGRARALFGRLISNGYYDHVAGATGEVTSVYQYCYYPIPVYENYGLQGLENPSVMNPPEDDYWLNQSLYDSELGILAAPRTNFVLLSRYSQLAAMEIILLSQF